MPAAQAIWHGRRPGLKLGASGFCDQGRPMTQYEKGIQHFEKLVFEALTRDERRDGPQ
jgi:hypothetical protein